MSNAPVIDTAIDDASRQINAARAASGRLPCDRANAPKVAGYGAASGLVSGFFGIGGGFLIVPGLIRSARMATIEAIGTSLVAVTAFGLTIAGSYALSGLVDWSVAATFVVGGLAGAPAGTLAAGRLSGGGKLPQVFAGILFLVAGGMIWNTLRN
jgi:uncharacterized membrane protein YfcA